MSNEQIPTHYKYSYDPVENRLQQITAGGDTTTYQYDAANRLAHLNGQAVYQFDDNPTPLRYAGLRGNLLNG